MATASSRYVLSKTLLLSVLMIFLGISAGLGSLNEAEFSELSKQNDVRNTILPLSQLNEPGFQEGSIFTDTTLSAGGSHTCALLDNGAVSCWGSNAFGQLGNGGTWMDDQTTPTLTSSLGPGRTAVALASGEFHTCAILDNGSVSCWGKGESGQLGNGGISNTSTPTLVSSLGIGRTAVAISAGDTHTCAILDNGEVSCWGYGSNGQLGDGRSSTTQTTPTLTSSLGSDRTAVAISAGGSHTCAILDNGAVSCWGDGSQGQLGIDRPSVKTIPTLTSSLGEGRTAVAISAGDTHTCAILDNGSVSCWGWGGRGELGNGENSQLDSPTLTSSLGEGRTAVAISAGYAHNCAILDNGEVWCWGYGSNGQLGNGRTIDVTTPTLTSSLGEGRTAVALTAGDFHTCAILDNGSVSCWGYGSAGQLGNGGTSENTAMPTLTSSLGSGRTVALSERDPNGDGTYTIFQTQKILDFLDYRGQAIATTIESTCVLLDNGSVSCWGRGYKGKLGNGATDNKYSPTLTSSLGDGRTAVALSSGDFHTCAILDNGSVSCWGAGGLGNGGSSYKKTPTLTSSLGEDRTAVAISAGGGNTCVILDNGAVSCWGSNLFGALGNGDSTERTTPTLTSSLGEGRTAVAISAGGGHTCAILDNGSVSCWGYGTFGQLGIDKLTVKKTPTLTSSLGEGRTAVTISSGGSHTCAILDNGSVSCWGKGEDGQLGNGRTIDVTTPTLTSSLGEGRTAVALSSGRSHTCAILDNGEVSCWGEGADGQLGNGGTSNASTPTLTSSLGEGRKAVALSSGWSHTCALLDNGEVSCWGIGESGELGNGGASDKTTPTLTSSLGAGRHALLVVGDQDGDGVYDHFDAYPQNTLRSVNCAAGQFGRYGCVDAPLGTYVPLSGAVRATNADAGYFVSSTGQTNQTPCAAGTYQANTGQSSCTDADAGYYVDQTGQLSQTACAKGTYQVNTGQSSCDDADAGYYVVQTGQMSQSACPEGTYQANTGQSSCKNAAPGYYVATTAQTAQVQCAVGTYQASPGQSSCVDADVGYYVDQPGQTSQTACPTGTHQESTGQANCEDVKLDDSDPVSALPAIGLMGSLAAVFVALVYCRPERK